MSRSQHQKQRPPTHNSNIHNTFAVIHQTSTNHNPPNAKINQSDSIETPPKKEHNTHIHNTTSKIFNYIQKQLQPPK